MKHIFCIIVLFSFSLSSMAQVYKWIDENGKTHYSQTPPPAREKLTSVQKMDKTGALMMIKPVKNGPDYYCGDLFVLSDQGGENVLYENIKTSIQSWEEERNEQQRYTEKLKIPGVNWDQHKVKIEEDKLAKYNCRVVWGNDKIKEFESFGYRAKRTNEDLEKQYKELKRRQDKECPADSSRFGSILVGDAARSWYKCHKGYERKMKTIKKKITENKKSVREMSK